MLKSVASPNRHQRLEDAIALLIQNQAAFLGRLADSDRRAGEIERSISDRFAKIEKDIAAILRVLGEQRQILDRLPEAVRDKIGFKS